MGQKTIIKVKNGGHASQFTLEDFHKDVITFGRSSQCDIKLENEKVSKTHGCFFKEGGVWNIQDMNSTNGTLLNGSKVMKSRISNNDTIILDKRSKDDSLEMSVYVLAVDTSYPPKNPPIDPPQPPIGPNPPIGLGMGWHSFLVYFALWAAAFFGILFGISLLSQMESSWIGELLGLTELGAIFKTWGVFMLIEGIVAVVAAIMLLQYKQLGPIMLYVYFGIRIAEGLILGIWGLAFVNKVDSFTFGLAGASGGYSFGATLLVNAFINVGLLIIHMIYYGNRKHMFRK